MDEIERVFREVYGQAVATLVRVFGDIAFAEDTVQDAFVIATERWPRDGTPPNPAGWIVTTARNRAIDRLRRQARGQELQRHAADVADARSPEQQDNRAEDGPMSDDRLRLIFTCCHPALGIESRVALTLRLLGGLSVSEVARSFLVSEPAMAKRLVRAKYKIRAANIPYRVPSDPDLPARLQSVLLVVYLIYNTGLDAGRAELRKEAIRLARVLVELMPDEAEAAGMLALVLLSEARVPARTRSEETVLLRDQDRSKWDRALIDEGQELVLACIRGHRPGPFQIQSQIQAIHSAAESFDTTDWPRIVALYDHLYALTPTPVVALNRAIAVGEVDGPVAALTALDEIAPDLDQYHFLHAARATELRELGRTDEARQAFERAFQLAESQSDRRFLARQIADI